LWGAGPVSPGSLEGFLRNSEFLNVLIHDKSISALRHLGRIHILTAVGISAFMANVVVKVPEHVSLQHVVGCCDFVEMLQHVPTSFVANLEVLASFHNVALSW
jgi:hypothetical protein